MATGPPRGFDRRPTPVPPAPRPACRPARAPRFPFPPSFRPVPAAGRQRHPRCGWRYWGPSTGRGALGPVAGLGLRVSSAGRRPQVRNATRRLEPLRRLASPVFSSTLPGGREYLSRVPGAATAPISDAELAELLNWALWNFDSSHVAPGFKPYTAAEVGALRARPFRTEAAEVRAKLLKGL